MKSLRSSKDGYEKCLQLSNEKITIAEQSLELFERHIRKLDMDLKRFTKDLETETPGLVESLQKSSLELDEKVTFKPEGPVSAYRQKSSGIGGPGRTPLGQNTKSLRGRTPLGLGLTSSGGKPRRRGRGASAFRSSSSTRQEGTFAVPLPTRGRGRGSRGPRGGRGARGARGSHSASPAVSHASLKSSSLNASFDESSLIGLDYLASPAGSTPTGDAGLGEVDLMADFSSGVPMPVAPDPNEPRYCICNQVSFGEMVGCDNKDCAIEWFHYACVGIEEPPKGKWYCQDCEASMKRRGLLP